MKNKILDKNSLDIIFNNARTYYHWLDQDIDNDTLKQVYDLAKMGPTSANICPMRIIFVKSSQAKEKLKTCLDAGNIDKTMSAAVTAIIAYDKKFYEYLPELFPHTDAKSWFVGNDKLIEESAFRNSSLQGAYLIIAARSLGLDCGPLSGFNKDKLDTEFFTDGRFKSNFLCNLGYGDPSKLYPRDRRFNFDEVNKIL